MPAPNLPQPAWAQPPTLHVKGRAWTNRLLVGLFVGLLLLVVVAGLLVGSPLPNLISNHLMHVQPSRAQAIFEMPYTKAVGAARFREVDPTAAPALVGSGVIEFGPGHAFSETLGDGPDWYEKELQVGGVAYEAVPGSKYQAMDAGPDHFWMVWDGLPPPPLEIASQTKVDGQRAWVLQESSDPSTRWVVGEQTGDPLEALLGGDTYTFSDWGHAPAIQAPPAEDVSTGLYSGSGSAPVVAPRETVKVLKEQVDYAAQWSTPGYRTVALEISYKNTAGVPADFGDEGSLVSSNGSGRADVTTFTPSLDGHPVAPGQTATGWVGYSVPEQATSFHLLLGDETDPDNSGYLISISVKVPR